MNGNKPKPTFHVEFEGPSASSFNIQMHDIAPAQLLLVRDWLDIVATEAARQTWLSKGRGSGLSIAKHIPRGG